MDLVAGVRKEGSRGGRDAFKWEDVKDDQHRENYLGHSLMAPVGRWQKNKDLSWYAKGDESQAAADAANARAEEIRRIKEAEQDALSEALGFPVQPRLRDSQLAGQKEVEKALKETTEGDDEGGKGVGFGNYLGTETSKQGNDEEVMKGHGGNIEDDVAEVQDDMSGGEEAGVGTEIETETMGATENENETEIAGIADTMIVDERRMMIAGITDDTVHGHGTGTHAEDRHDITKSFLATWLFHCLLSLHSTSMSRSPQIPSIIDPRSTARLPAQMETAGLLYNMT
ncbi:MAG: hypothetical protein LQ349_001059 [Xanthoria aureola]|nr:MAG: hypothetical protein LQ349_001059 [Xanthoria aureola]